MNPEKCLDESLSNEERVKAFDSLNLFSKNFIFGMAMREAARRDLEDAITKECYSRDRMSLVVAAEGWAVCEYMNDNSTKDSPYTGLFKDSNGTWHKTNYVWPTIEEAVFCAIGCKFEGLNSKFAQYAYRMLDKSEN